MGDKHLYLDLETTGLDPKKNGIVQLAAIYTEDGEEISTIDITMNPSTRRGGVEIDDKALQINKRTRDEIASFQDYDSAFTEFIGWLDQYVDEEVKWDIMIPVGFNSSQFDIPFLKEWFAAQDEEYHSYFGYKDVDVFAFVKVLKFFKKFESKNDQLKTLCKKYDIEINAHEAMSDIRATKELFKVLEEKYL
jgi:DNA polymerase III alpha subunit (gram-positive type)